MEFFNPEFIGIVGAVTYLISYAILQYKRDFARTLEYSFLNLIASSFVLYSLMTHWNLPSAIIQISWIVISLYGIWKTSQRLRI